MFKKKNLKLEFVIIANIFPFSQKNWKLLEKEQNKSKVDRIEIGTYFYFKLHDKYVGTFTRRIRQGPVLKKPKPKDSQKLSYFQALSSRYEGVINFI